MQLYFNTNDLIVFPVWILVVIFENYIYILWIKYAFLCWAWYCVFLWQRGVRRLSNSHNCIWIAVTHWGRDKMAAIFPTTFSNANIWISIKLSLTFLPKGPINNIPVLIQMMAWHRPGDKPLSEAIMVWCIYVSLGLRVNAMDRCEFLMWHIHRSTATCCG